MLSERSNVNPTEAGSGPYDYVRTNVRESPYNMSLFVILLLLCLMVFAMLHIDTLLDALLICVYLGFWALVYVFGIAVVLLVLLALLTSK